MSGLTAPQSIIQRVERYDSNLATYRSTQYNEASLRVDFLDSFFGMDGLGWDVHYDLDVAERYKDVVVEEPVAIGSHTKRTDYVFRIGGVSKFVVEAKRPSVNILTDSDAAYQLKSYGWNKHLNLCVLTNFEHFAIYDVRKPPKLGDEPRVGRIRAPYSYKDYLTKWGEIASIFSKDSVLKGRFDAEAEKTERPGNEPVDKYFLKAIEAWRHALAPHLKLRNQDLTQPELNSSVQTILDRMIFLRICEDRGVEPRGRLKACASGEGVYGRLLDLFRLADQRYNSGLFHFEAERGRPSAPDELAPRLVVDDEILRGILLQLYDSPYDFREIPLEVLGEVYEQFLGKVIVVTEKRARVEEKPEVKKAGGVFYTPQYVVSQIVGHTLGKLVAGKTPEEIFQLKIVDPACGSGSFLLGVYQYLLDWYLEEYSKDPKKWRSRIVEVGNKTYVLTPEERVRILLNSIFGVDIDPQAVEVTKLSLLLKVLEKTPGEVIDRQLKLAHARALPDLGSNVRCGNSLLDYRQLGNRLLGDDERRRVNPFDWKTEFPTAFARGGFDAVVGNPPYVRIQTMKEWAPLEVELYKDFYRSAGKGNFDIYGCFIEKALTTGAPDRSPPLLNRGGKLGFIVQHRFFNSEYGEPLRDLISKGRYLSGIVHFGTHQIFEGATTYTCLLFLDKQGSPEFTFQRVDDLDRWRLTGEGSRETFSADRVSPAGWNFTIGPDSPLVDKLGQCPTKLSDIAELFVGCQTDADSVFILDEIRQEESRVLCRSKATGREHWFENGHLKRLLKGSLNIRRYSLSGVSKRLIFPYETVGNRALLIEADDYARRFPLTWAYLELNKQRLVKRNKGHMGREWYGYVYKKNHEKLGTPKLVVPAMVNGPCFASDLGGEYFFVGSGAGGGGGYGIRLKAGRPESPLYLLGLLNSRLLGWYLQRVSYTFQGKYFAANKQFIGPLPIRTIDPSNPDALRAHERVVNLVEDIQRMTSKFESAKTEGERTLLLRQFTALDEELDRTVYGLYALTPEEINLVDGDRPAAAPWPMYRARSE
jgi:hypothetical protein